MVQFVFTTALLLVPVAAAAQQQSVCLPGNLLAHATSLRQQRASRTERITDGAVPAEGAFWNTPNTAVLNGGDSFLDYDLGQVTGINAIYLQGDNNDTYELHGSLDGRSFSPIWTAPAVDGSGMRRRTIENLGVEARYLRVGFGQGDGYFSIGELQIFCQKPAVWPPRLKVIQDKGTDRPTWTRAVRMSLGKITTGLLGVILFVGLLWSPSKPRKGWVWIPHAVGVTGAIFAGWATYGWTAGVILILAGIAWSHSLNRRRLRGLPWKPLAERVALITMLAVCGHTWINFGTFHGPRAVHLWDAMHYYMGSKYFKENRYRLYYSCAAVAETDDGRKDEVLKRKYRELATNTLGHGDKALLHTDECHARFSEHRWDMFRQDLRLFRALMSPSWFKGAFEDHGYNATPTWNMVGTVLSNWGAESFVPPNELVDSPNNREGMAKEDQKKVDARFAIDREHLRSRLNHLALIDGALYTGCFLLIIWAFGLRTGTYSAIVWASGHPWAYYWTGGGFGRIPYLFMAIAGLCLLEKGKPLLAGFAIAWSGLLRVFPAAIAGGLALKALWLGGKHKRVDRTHLRLLAGALLAFAILIPASLPSADGLSAYPEFLSNSLKHRATPLTNDMGLPTLLSWHPDHVGRKVKDGRADDPFLRWKQLRRQHLSERKILYWGLVIALFLLVGIVVWPMEDWESVSLSSVFIFALFELTCYYYNFMLLLAPLAFKRFRHAMVLLGLSIATQIASLAVGWFDERYLLDSLLVLAVFVYFLLDIYFERQREQDAAELNAKSAAREA